LIRQNWIALLAEGKYICELGLFANDPDVGEILYGYANAGEKGDYIAPNNAGAFAWNYQVNAAIGNAINVTATVSNTYFDYAIASTSSAFTVIHGSNQKEINENIDAYLANLPQITIGKSEPANPKSGDIWCKII
jgi:hypothetical protein